MTYSCETERRAGAGRRSEPERLRPARERPEGGFALMAALLALVGLTALAAAGFLRSGSDHRVSQNHQATVQAFYVADAGLRTFLARHRGPAGAPVQYTFDAGTATVSMTPITRPGDTDQLYLVTSQGVHLPPEGGRAVRTVSQVSLASFLTLEVPGALASGIGIQKNGGAGTIDGNDESLSGDCPVGGQPARPGVALPPGSYQQSGGDTVPQGNPRIHEEDGYSLLENTGIDWDGIVNGGILVPDYVLPPDAWPDFSGLSSDDWPVIYVDDDWIQVDPEDSGRGTLIVRGDLTMNGNFQWNGLILAGGAIMSDGNQTVKGGAITGLNLLLGETPSTTNLGNGTKTFQYHSCNAYEAMSRLSTLSAQPGSWFERL